MFLRCNRVGFPAALLGALLLAGCAAKRPVLYPNDQYQRAGAAAAEADIEGCISLAEAHGNTADQSGKVATNTAVGAGVSSQVSGALLLPTWKMKSSAVIVPC